jgi:hypothetical protein
VSIFLRACCIILAKVRTTFGQKILEVIQTWFNFFESGLAAGVSTPFFHGTEEYIEETYVPRSARYRTLKIPTAALRHHVLYAHAESSPQACLIRKAVRPYSLNLCWGKCCILRPMAKWWNAATWSASGWV